LFFYTPNNQNKITATAFLFLRDLRGGGGEGGVSFFDIKMGTVAFYNVIHKKYCSIS